MYATAMRHWGKLSPRCLFEDVPSPAGSEIAMMSVARELAARGHTVRVFADCDPGLYDGVEYLRAELALPLLTQVEHDVIVSWQDAGLFLYPVKAKLKVLMCQGSQLALGQASEHTDRYFAISRYSAKLLLESDAYASPDKMWVTRNGVYAKRFTPHSGHNRHQLVWASSPDRGLHHLVDIFEKVRAAVPDATLSVLYDFDRVYESYHNTLPGSAFCRYLEEAAVLKVGHGVEVLNHISQPQLAKLLSGAGIMAYPCDPIHPTETYCVAVNEAMAAGLPCVLSDADCLPENYGGHALILKRPIDTSEWATHIVRLMTNREEYASYQDCGLQLAKETEPSGIAEEWEMFFDEYLTGRGTTPDRSLSARLDG